MKEFNLEEFKKNPSQKVVTRDGREVRIICTDAKGDYKSDYPIIGLVTIEENKELAYKFQKNGEYYLTNEESSLDLFFAPIKKEGWVNIYKSNSRRDRIAGDVFPSEKEAKEGKTIGYITTIKIEWEE